MCLHYTTASVVRLSIHAYLEVYPTLPAFITTPFKTDGELYDVAVVHHDDVQNPAEHHCRQKLRLQNQRIALMSGITPEDSFPLGRLVVAAAIAEFVSSFFSAPVPLLLLLLHIIAQHSGE